MTYTMKCKKCFWICKDVAFDNFLKQFTKAKQKRLQKESDRFICPLRGYRFDMIGEQYSDGRDEITEDELDRCPDHVYLQSYSEMVQSTRDDLKLNRNDFLFLLEDDEESFRLLSNDEKSKRCCILLQCRPTRQLIKKVSDSPAFKAKILHYLSENLSKTTIGATDTLNDAESLEKEVEIQYHQICEEAHRNIKAMEVKCYEGRDDRGYKYLNRKIAVATAFFGTITERISSPSWKKLLVDLFRVSEKSIRNYYKSYLKDS